MRLKPELIYDHNSEALRADHDFILKTVQIYGSVLEYTSPDLQNNPEFVLASVKQNGSALEYASEELKNNLKIVLIAVSQEKDALQYASLQLKSGGLEHYVKNVHVFSMVESARAINKIFERIRDIPHIFNQIGVYIGIDEFNNCVLSRAHMVFRRFGFSFPKASTPYPVEMMALSASQIENTSHAAPIPSNNEENEPCTQVSYR